MWRTDTIIVSKLNKAPVPIKPPLNGLEINKPPEGLNRGFTVSTLKTKIMARHPNKNLSHCNNDRPIPLVR